MTDTLVTTGKTVEDALAAALAELKVGREAVEYVVLEQPEKKLFGLLGSRPARIKVTVKEPPAPEESAPVVDEVSSAESAEKSAPETETTDESDEETAAVGGEFCPKETTDKQRLAMDDAEKFLRDVFAAMNVAAKIDRREHGDTVVFNLSGERLGILIGKRGQTLDSLQYLANLAVNRDDAEGRVRVIVDVENYRRRREETLRALALRLAGRARYLNEEVKLEPMNRHDRKVIHMALAKDNRVTTYSDGEDPYRRVVIAPRRERGGTNRRRDARE